MSLLKTRPTMDALQRIMTSFKQFERKLDRLQEDVSYHGKTLRELRALVSNLSGDGTITPDLKQEEVKPPHKKFTTMQYDHIFEEPLNRRKKKPITPFPYKMRPNSLDSPRDRIFDKPFPNKIKATPKVSPAKHLHKSMKQIKADALHKGSTRNGRILNQKRSKLQKA